MSEEKSLKEPDMESAIKAFKDWRSNRKKLCRIPEVYGQLQAIPWSETPEETLGAQIISFYTFFRFSFVRLKSKQFSWHHLYRKVLYSPRFLSDIALKIGKIESAV